MTFICILTDNRERVKKIEKKKTDKLKTFSYTLVILLLHVRFFQLFLFFASFVIHLGHQSGFGTEKNNIHKHFYMRFVHISWHIYFI